LFYFIAKRVNDFSDYFVLALLIFPGGQSKGRTDHTLWHSTLKQRRGEKAERA
jgi:hypothetical protein